MTPDELNFMTNSLNNAIRDVGMKACWSPDDENAKFYRVISEQFRAIDLLTKEVKRCWDAPSEHATKFVGRKTALDVAIAATCKHFSISEKRLMGHSRLARSTHIRQVGMYMAREVTGQSYHFIAERFGKSHSSVAYARVVISRKITINKDNVCDDIAAIQSIIAERLERPKEAAE